MNKFGNIGRLICAITGHHKWDHATDDIPDGTMFYRIDCVRCGFAIDGVRAKRAKELLGKMRLGAHAARMLP